MKVCEKVQKKGVTSYNEVADELVAEFSNPRNMMSPQDAVSFPQGYTDSLVVFRTEFVTFGPDVFPSHSLFKK